MDVTKATKFLKDGYVLVSYTSKNREVFIYENKIVSIYTKNYNSQLTMNDFIALYQNKEFEAIKTEEEFKEDKLKDSEYYQKLQRRQ